MPEAIGPYTIVREIGRGGMGVVYEGWDDRLGRSVAIKTIIRAADSQMRDRFLREARAAAAVSHPHICQLFDIGEHQGDPFLCMELLEGRSLAERLLDGPLSVSEAVAIELAILSAVAALHRRGIVHRDLKPTSVFLASNGIKRLLGQPAEAIALLDRAVASGFHCPRAFETSPLLDPLRGTPEFAGVIARARQGHAAAAIAFVAADGDRLLGLSRA